MKKQPKPVISEREQMAVSLLERAIRVITQRRCTCRCSPDCRDCAEIRAIAVGAAKL
jgi:hypothetical protein